MERGFEHHQEQEPKIVIRKSTDAPPEVKSNPFYDPEFWGRGEKADEIYLPDSDEAISFAIAIHEVGHLVEDEEKARLHPALDNFTDLRAEEARAWRRGHEYLEKYINDYFQDPVKSAEVLALIKQIEDLMTEGVEISEEFYLPEGQLDRTSDEERRKIRDERRKMFIDKDLGKKMMEIFQQIKNCKIGVKTDWDKFTAVVQRAVEDIIRDNEKRKL